MEGAMLYRKFPAYNSNVSSTIPSDNLVRSVRSFTIPITTNFGLFSQMLKVTLETFLMRRVTLIGLGRVFVLLCTAGQIPSFTMVEGDVRHKCRKYNCN